MPVLKFLEAVGPHILKRIHIAKKNSSVGYLAKGNEWVKYYNSDNKKEFR